MLFRRGVHVQEGVMELLALATPIGGCALFHEMPWFETIQAQMFGLQNYHHLVMWKLCAGCFPVLQTAQESSRLAVSDATERGGKLRLDDVTSYCRFLESSGAVDSDA